MAADRTVRDLARRLGISALVRPAARHGWDVTLARPDGRTLELRELTLFAQGDQPVTDDRPAGDQPATDDDWELEPTASNVLASLHQGDLTLAGADAAAEAAGRLRTFLGDDEFGALGPLVGGREPRRLPPGFVFAAVNRHPPEDGIPDAILGDGYLRSSCFESGSGDQWVFTWDGERATLRGGGLGWEDHVNVKDGQPVGQTMLLEDDEAAWLAACWMAVEGSRAG